MVIILQLLIKFNLTANILFFYFKTDVSFVCSSEQTYRAATGTFELATFLRLKNPG